MKIDHQPFFFKMTIKCLTETLKDGIVAKLQRHIAFAAKIIDCYSFVFIKVHDKRLLDPSVLSPDVYVYLRTPGTPPCRFLHV